MPKMSVMTASGLGVLQCDLKDDVARIATAVDDLFPAFRQIARDDISRGSHGPQ